MNRLALTALLLPFLAMGSCMVRVGPDHAGAPAVDHSGSFTGSDSGGPAVDRWWRELKNPRLNKIIESALEKNFDVRIGKERIVAARALRREAASAFLPQVGSNLSYTRLDLGDGDGDLSGQLTQTGFFQDPSEYWGAGFDVSWEIDVFGGRRRQAEAANARAESAREAMAGVRLAIGAELTETWYTIAGLREQLALRKKQVASQQSQVQDAEAKFKAGATTRLEVERAKSRLETTRMDLPSLEASIVVQLRRLALLAGEAPDSMDKRNIANGKLPRKLPMIKTGMPAELVTRRPDLREAERDLAAATADIGVAVSNFYPKFTLMGAPTGTSGDLGNLFDPASYTLEFGPRVEWALFTGGRTRAILDQANASQRQALLNYEKKVLAAIGEVESQLAGLKAETRRLAIVQRAVNAEGDVVKRVRELEKDGAIDKVEVLTEEENLRELEIMEIRVKNQLIQEWVRLHKALGGGWKEG